VIWCKQSEVWWNTVRLCASCVRFGEECEVWCKQCAVWWNIVRFGAIIVKFGGTL